MLTYITREQDYALRIISHLAKCYPNNHIPVSQLSKELYITKNFAARIVHKLKIFGLVGTNQGKNGGAFLIEDPNNISIYDVISKSGNVIRLNQCLNDHIYCGMKSFCNFHIYFNELEDDLTNKLKQKKISEFI